MVSPFKAVTSGGPQYLRDALLEYLAFRVPSPPHGEQHAFLSALSETHFSPQDGHDAGEPPQVLTASPSPKTQGLKISSPCTLVLSGWKYEKILEWGEGGGGKGEGWCKKRAAEAQLSQLSLHLFASRGQAQHLGPGAGSLHSESNTAQKYAAKFPRPKASMHKRHAKMSRSLHTNADNFRHKYRQNRKGSFYSKH